MNKTSLPLGWRDTCVAWSRAKPSGKVEPKAWTDSEGKKDQEILAAAVNAQRRWPWSTTDAFVGRLTEANERRTRPHGKKIPPERAAGRG